MPALIAGCICKHQHRHSSMLPTIAVRIRTHTLLHPTDDRRQLTGLIAETAVLFGLPVVLRLCAAVYVLALPRAIERSSDASQSVNKPSDYLRWCSQQGSPLPTDDLADGGVGLPCVGKKRPCNVIFALVNTHTRELGSYYLLRRPFRW